MTLRCSTVGASSGVSYRWTSTCRSCFASNSYSSSISESILRSRDDGYHTCTATDGIGNTGSNGTRMNIVGKYSPSITYTYQLQGLNTGAGVYVSFSRGYAGRQAAQPDNTYINIDSYPASSHQRVLLYCCSNSRSSSIGSFTEPSGSSYYYSFNHFSIERYYSSSVYAGCIRMEASRNPWYYLSYNQGMYTCNIPDSYGRTQRVNFGLYSETSKY